MAGAWCSLWLLEVGIVILYHVSSLALAQKDHSVIGVRWPREGSSQSNGKDYQMSASTANPQESPVDHSIVRTLVIILHAVGGVAVSVLCTRSSLSY